MSRKFIFGGSYASIQYLMDIHPAPVAYSVQKINSTATLCLRVRRASDNAELDIGFSGNSVDTSSILSFAPSQGCAVVKWYNQGTLGSACDASQTTIIRQASVVLSATPNIITTDSKGNISIKFQLTSALLVFGSGGVFKNKTFGAAFTVYENNIINARRDIFGWQNNTAANPRFFVTDSLPTLRRHSLYTRRLDGDSNSILTDAVNFPAGVKQRTDIIDWGNADAFIRRNNIQVAASTSHGTSGSTSNTDSYTTMAASNTSGVGQCFTNTPVEGISEIVFYNTDVSTDISSIELNQLSRYATT